MNIAFVFPEVYDVARYGKRRKEFPPFGVLYLATIVSQQKGMNVQVFSVESKDTALDLTTFDVVAFCIPSSVTYHVIEGVRYNSTYMDGALLIAGGVHVNFFPAITLRDLAVHAVGVGNSDETILELIAQKDTRQFQDIKGICFDDKGRAVRTPNRPLKSSLDHLPAIPNRSLLPDQDIVSRRLAGTDLKMVHVMFSQGCPFVCNFCAAAQRKLLYRSGAHIVRELEHLKRVYGIEGFAVVGDNFLVNKKKVREISRAIAPLDLKWSTLSRTDTVDRESIECMRDAGCIEIKFGIESGSERILHAMGKRTTRAEIVRAVQMTHDIGVGVKAFIIHGYPGENLESTRETIALLRELSGMISRITLFRFVPLPGSPVFETHGNLLRSMGDDWKKSHIHHNPHHWWGTEADFAEVQAGYEELRAFIDQRWGL